MTFSPFKESREHMELQYERYARLADGERAEALYRKIRAAYDAEKHTVLGKARAMACYLDEVEIFINPYDIFADLCDTAITSTPVRIRKEIYSSYHKKSGEVRRLSSMGAIFAHGDYSHTMPDWERLLSLGFRGIADDAEIDQATAKSWLHILETLGIVFLLQPYSNNVLKRTVSTPKLYFYDTGLVCYLTRWTSAETANGSATARATECICATTTETLFSVIWTESDKFLVFFAVRFNVGTYIKHML